MWTRAPVSSARAISRKTMISSATRGIAAQPQAHALDALVHDRALGQLHVLAVAEDGAVEHRQYSIARRMISELTTGEPSSVNATAPPSTRPPISASSAPLRPLVMRADGEDVGVAGALGLEVDELGRRLAVDGRLGVGHARDAGHAAGQGGGGAGGDGLVLLAARLAEVDVHVDQPGADDLAGGVEGGVGAQVGPVADGQDACRPRSRGR